MRTARSSRNAATSCWRREISRQRDSSSSAPRMRGTRSRHSAWQGHSIRSNSPRRAFAASKATRHKPTIGISKRVRSRQERNSGKQVKEIHGDQISSSASKALLRALRSLHGGGGADGSTRHRDERRKGAQRGRGGT